ncbi:glycosyltransferase family 2 protein [Citrobacter freundii]
MKKPTDISIIIPAFNAQNTIGDLVASLLSEKDVNAEVIVVDDGSTDDTAAILHAIGDERLVFISQKNLGVYAARNAALAVHRGEWVVFLDADDRTEEGSFEERTGGSGRCRYFQWLAYRQRWPATATGSS